MLPNYKQFKKDSPDLKDKVKEYSQDLDLLSVEFKSVKEYINTNISQEKTVGNKKVNQVFNRYKDVGKQTLMLINLFIDPLFFSSL